MWPPRYTSQLEITVNIAHKGCAVACIVCPQDKLSKTYNLYPENKLIRDLSFDTFKTAIDKVPLTTELKDGIIKTIEWYRENKDVLY